MSFFVVCTFDLLNGSPEDYKTAYAELMYLGLSKSINSSSSNKITLPTTTTAGEFTGVNATNIRDDLAVKIKSAFSRHHFKAEIFLSVGGDWCWQHNKI